MGKVERSKVGKAGKNEKEAKAKEGKSLKSTKGKAAKSGKDVEPVITTSSPTVVPATVITTSSPTVVPAPGCGCLQPSLTGEFCNCQIKESDCLPPRTWGGCELCCGTRF